MIRPPLTVGGLNDLLSLVFLPIVPSEPFYTIGCAACSAFEYSSAALHLLDSVDNEAFDDGQLPFDVSRNRLWYPAQ